MPFTAEGVIPATLVAFNQDFEIDVAASRKHLRDVAAVDGLNAITVNGHASEIHAFTLNEQQRLLVAKMAESEGASALLVFPPNSMSMGGQLCPDMAINHFRMIASATDLPLILFQYPASTGLGYPFETMLRIFEEVPKIVAIKDWCNDPMLHERHIRTFQSLPRRVNVLSTHSSWLMASLSMKPAGLLSGAGSVIADLQVELFTAMQRNDLALARTVNDRIYPLAQAFYRAPFLDMHNRMKECLVLLGRLDEAVVRPPLQKLDETEISYLEEALVDAGLLVRTRRRFG